MDELLKDAIADAKAVRETALANAKLALEEAFTPRLKSMLSKKIQSEMEDAVEELDIEELEDEEDVEDEMGDEAPEDDMEDEGSYSEDDEDPGDEFSDEEAPEDDMGDEAPEDDMGDEDEEMEDEGVIEINGVKYAPIREDEEFTEGDESDEEDDEVDEGEDLDLDEILRELEEDDSVDEAEEPVDEAEDVDESKEEVDEQSTSSGIGKGTSVKQGSGSDEEDPGKGKLKEAEDVDESKDEVDESDEVDEDVDLEEVIRALTEDDAEASIEEVKTLKGDLKEHRKVVKYLREKLNEVNLLNAKLLFTNKIFRAFGMTNEQKMKVVETFDRAKTLREIKLVYTTVAENFDTKTIKPIKETKGSASKAVASTKSGKQEIISEGTEMKQRFQKLANIL